MWQAYEEPHRLLQKLIGMLLASLENWLSHILSGRHAECKHGVEMQHDHA